MMRSSGQDTGVPIFLFGALTGWMASAMMRTIGNRPVRTAEAAPRPSVLSATVGHMTNDVANLSASLMAAVAPAERDAERLTRLIQKAIASLNVMYKFLNRQGDRYAQQMEVILDDIIALTKLNEDVLLNDPTLAAALNTIETQSGILDTASKQMQNDTQTVKSINNAITAANKIVGVFPKPT